MTAQPAELRLGGDVARALAHLGPQAPEEIATHLRKFWDPRMRSAILRRWCPARRSVAFTCSRPSWVISMANMRW